MGQGVIGDVFKALGQIGDRRFRSILFRSIGLTLILLIAAVWGGDWLLDAVLPISFSLPYFGEISLPELPNWLSFGALGILAIFAIIPVATIIIGVFLEQVADAVEARHYPSLPPARDIGVGEMAWEIIRFLTLVIVVNLLALIIYFASNLLAPVIFYLINGLLLGREYFHLVAARRLPRAEADRLRRANRIGNWLTGTLLAIPLTIPIFGLIIPILGVAVFTHRFHRLNKA